MIETTAKTASRRQITTEEPSAGTRDSRAGGKCRVDGLDTEESAAKSAERSGEETDESASEEEAETTGGAGEVVIMPTATLEALGGSGTEDGLGVSAAGGGATSDSTNTDADAAGAGDHHGVENRKRERVTGRREKPAGKSSGVGEREGAPTASRVAENPGGHCQGVGGGVKLPRGTDTYRSRGVAPSGRNLRSDPRGQRSAGDRQTGARRRRKNIQPPRTPRGPPQPAAERR